MFGTRQIFTYGECLDCGTLELLDKPDDLSPYYPSKYYSFTNAVRPSLYRSIKGIVFRFPFGNLCSRTPLHRTIFGYGLRRNTRVLDVGCGAGKFLCDLAFYGLRCLTGIDPYLSAEGNPCDNARLIKANIFEIQGEWDLITISHALEHMERPVEVLSKASDLLSSRGICVVSIPVVGQAWETYRENWVQLDAPRHLFIYTEKGMTMTCNKAGLRIVQIKYDSTAFQFWGSELYQKDIPLIPKDECAAFSAKQLSEFSRRANLLNRERRGDQAIFVLRKQ